VITRIRARLGAVDLGAPTTPLAVLFLLNTVDELDQVTFGAVAPEIRDTFELSEQAVTTLAAVASALVISLIVPIGVFADRHNRVRMSAIAAAAWGSMSVLTGVAGFVAVFPLLVTARVGAGLGRVMNEPVHASLLADYYPPTTHGRVFSIHRTANPVGLMLVLPCAFIADVIGWRLAFVLIAVPTLVAVTMLGRLHEPIRGASMHATLAAQADQRARPVPVREGYRRLKAVPTLRRFWAALFLLGAAVIPITTFFAFFFENVYDVESITARGAILTVYGAGVVVGLQLASRWSTGALMAGRIPHLATLGGRTLLAVAAALFATAVAPWLGLSIALFFVVGVSGAGFTSYYLPLVAAVAPPRLRSQAYAWSGLWFAIGAIVVTPIVSGIGENQGYRVAIPILSVLVAISGLVFASARHSIQPDAEAAFATLLAAD
jgi:MFS family permease